MTSLTTPSRVVQFLITPFHRDFDPTLAFLALGALPVATTSYYFGRGEEQPRLGGKWDVPKGGMVDRRLLVGAAIFGIGWGIQGLCRTSFAPQRRVEPPFDIWTCSRACTREFGNHCRSKTFGILVVDRVAGSICPRWRLGRDHPTLNESFRC